MVSRVHPFMGLRKPVHPSDFSVFFKHLRTRRTPQLANQVEGAVRPLFRRTSPLKTREHVNVNANGGSRNFAQAVQNLPNPPFALSEPSPPSTYLWLLMLISAHKYREGDYPGCAAPWMDLAMGALFSFPRSKRSEKNAEECPGANSGKHPEI